MRRRRRFRERYVEYAIILTLVVFAAYIAIYLYSTTGEDKKFKLTSDACHEFGGVCRSSCFNNEIQKTRCGDQLVCCVEVFAVNPDDQVYLKYAFENKDIGECAKITDAEMQASCKLKILDMQNKQFAMKYNDKKYCELVEDETERTDCIVSLAERNSDVKFCEGIEDANERNKCVARIALAAKDAEACLSITSEILKNSCLKDIAIESGKTVICNQITMDIEANDCRLKVELKAMTKGYAKCVNLPESECGDNERCKPVYFTADCVECAKKFFEICMPNDEKICEETFGTWDILGDDCNCHEKAWFPSFGCYSCDEFKEEFSKDECQQRIAQSI